MLLWGTATLCQKIGNSREAAQIWVMDAHVCKGLGHGHACMQVLGLKHAETCLWSPFVWTLLPVPGPPCLCLDPLARAWTPLPVPGTPCLCLDPLACVWTPLPMSGPPCLCPNPFACPWTPLPTLSAVLYDIWAQTPCLQSCCRA